LCGWYLIQFLSLIFCLCDSLELQELVFKELISLVFTYSGSVCTCLVWIFLVIVTMSYIYFNWIGLSIIITRNVTLFLYNYFREYLIFKILVDLLYWLYSYLVFKILADLLYWLGNGLIEASKQLAELLELLYSRSLNWWIKFFKVLAELVRQFRSYTIVKILIDLLYWLFDWSIRIFKTLMDLLNWLHSYLIIKILIDLLYWLFDWSIRIFRATVVILTAALFWTSIWFWFLMFVGPQGDVVKCLLLSVHFYLMMIMVSTVEYLNAFWWRINETLHSYFRTKLIYFLYGLSLELPRVIYEAALRKLASLRWDIRECYRNVRRQPHIYVPQYLFIIFASIYLFYFFYNFY